MSIADEFKGQEDLSSDEDQHSPEESNKGGNEKKGYDFPTSSAALAELEKLSKGANPNKVSAAMEQVMGAFKEIKRVQREELKERFLADGGNLEDFAPASDAEEIQAREIWHNYLAKRNEYTKQEQRRRSNNLYEKKELLEQLRMLKEKPLTASEMRAKYNQLTQEWESIGEVPRTDIRKLEADYRFAKRLFHDYMNIAFETKREDEKRNQELKNKLCERAKDLLKEKRMGVRTKKMKQLHKGWKNVGYAGSEEENLWQRFREISRQANEEIHEHFREVRVKQKEIIARKRALINKTKELIKPPHKELKDWSATTEKISAIRQEWTSIKGGMRSKESEEVYAEFRKVCDTFYDDRKAFYTQNGDLFKHTETLLQQLIDRAKEIYEGVKDEEWEQSTHDIIKLQREWKGVVKDLPLGKARKYYKKFRTICDNFFAKKKEEREHRQEKYEEINKARASYLKELEATAWPEETQELKSFILEQLSHWKTLGFVPRKEGKEVSQQFRKLLSSYAQKLQLSNTEQMELNYRIHLVEEMTGDRIRSEQIKIRQEIEKKKQEVLHMEENLHRFSANSNETFRNEISEKIDKAQQRIKELKEQRGILRTLLKSNQRDVDTTPTEE